MGRQRPVFHHGEDAKILAKCEEISAFFEGKKHAFTLAEVLITLVIIGVIAALTIPNLMQKYQEQTTVKKVQKFYSNLSNAYSMAMKENGPSSEWGVDISEAGAIKIYELLFKPYFKITKNCGVDNTGKCITNKSYKALNNEPYSTYHSDKAYYKIILDDGAAVWWRGGNSDSERIFLFYDVNGIKEPNQFGKDLFTFVSKNDKIAPNGIQTGYYSTRPFNTHCKNTTTTGLGCAAWLIYKGNMDYLHCDLTWDKHSCKD